MTGKWKFFSLCSVGICIPTVFSKEIKTHVEEKRKHFEKELDFGKF